MNQATPLNHVISVIEAQGRRYDWLAEQIGVSKSHLAHTLAGRRRMTEQMATDIARVLGVPAEYIQLPQKEALPIA